MKSEEARQQIILIVDGPAAGETEALSQPQHRLGSSNRSARRSEGLKAADLRHVLLHSELVALDPLLLMLVTYWTGSGCRRPSSMAVLIADGNIGAVGTDLTWGE